MVYSVGVLGATGLVGQRFISLLNKHPWFRVELVTASPQHVGKKYREAVNWVLNEPIPSDIGELELKELNPDLIAKENLDLVFSALPSDVSFSVEIELLKRGINIVSNASSFRLYPDVPLLNPEVNADHIKVVEAQRRRGWRATLTKVPNCSTAILTLPLKPIMDEFGIKRVIVSTMQALSGAGLKGVPSVAIVDNVIPYIKGEEEKIERETLKILGEFREGEIREARIKISASAHRVMVLDGHLEAVFVETIRHADVESVKDILMKYEDNKIRGMGLPSAPEKPVIVTESEDRPQPRLDRMTGKGMSVVVGRIREDKALNGIKFMVLGHNTIRGAAGTGLLIAELMIKEGIIRAEP